MFPAAALLMSQTLAALLLPVSPLCENEVSCPCGFTGQNYKFCNIYNMATEDFCQTWSRCLQCQDEVDYCLGCPVGMFGDTCSQTTWGTDSQDSPAQTWGKDSQDSSAQTWGKDSQDSSAQTWGKDSQSPSGFQRAFICKDPGFLPDGTRKRIDGSPANRSEEFREGEVLIFSCRRGFALEGSSMIICRKDRKWSDILPRCLRTVVGWGANAGSCADPGTLMNGNRFNTDGANPVQERTYRRGQSVVFSCHSGFALHGTSMITCQRLGVWSRGKPFCSRVANPRNRTMTSAPTGTWGKDSQVSSAFQVWGKDSRVPSDSGNAYAEDIMYCKSPGPIFNGKIDVLTALEEEGYHSTNDFKCAKDDDEYPQGTILQYTCEEGYMLSGNAVTTCEDTGFWSVKPPTCVGGCGTLSAEISNPVTRLPYPKGGEWPWMVSVGQLNPSSLICGGVLLNSRTVLTAASCFEGEKVQIGLMFGKYKWWNEDNDAKVIYRTNVTVKIHPNFNRSLFTANIAIVKFSPSISFSDRVHPICLPTTKTTAKNIVGGRKGYVITWGIDKERKTAESLLTSHLSVIEGTSCLKGSKVLPPNWSNLFQTNVFCVDFFEGPHEICYGDKGSPMVFYDNVKKRFILEGLLSFADTGTCGLPGSYTALTEVLPYVPWILQNLT